MARSSGTRTKQRSKTHSTARPIARSELYATTKRDRLGHLFVEKALHERGFTGEIATDPETCRAYSTDESVFSIEPQIVLKPKTVQDVQIAVKLLADESARFSSLSLTPRAAGTGLSGGSLTDSIVLDVCAHLTDFGTVTEIKDGATITCQPGAMWRDVDAALTKQGYYLPPYPASRDICSIGGAVGNNAAGPDSLRHGHVADWVQSLDVVLSDGNTYTIEPLTYKQLTKLTKKKHAYARIAKEIFALIEANESVIARARPKTNKNTAGYALWDVLDGSVKEFKRGVGTFDLTRLISGSQGTIGVVVGITMRAAPVQRDTVLIAVPVFDLQNAGRVVNEALRYNPLNIEVFDDLTFDLALKNPNFFRERLSGNSYYKSLVSLYVMYHVRYLQKTPAFTLLVTLDDRSLSETRTADILAKLKEHARLARVIVNPHEAEMLWQLRRASYPLSKMQDRSKRPAPFLEDMVVPPENLAPFFAGIKKLLKKYNVIAAIHGHGGDGHFHFYPLLDFTRKSTPALIERMAEEFFSLALKYDGGLCGEHNDGIIRTPHLSKMFSKAALELFRDVEHIFDPNDIFNPGKKTNPRYDITSSVRTTN